MKDDKVIEFERLHAQRDSRGSVANWTPEEMRQQPQFKYGQHTPEVERLKHELEQIQREETRIGMAVIGISLIMIGFGIYFYFQI